MGGSPDPVSGEQASDEQTVRNVGAVDAASVRENRRITRIVHKKRTGQQDIPINVDDVLVKYDTILRLYPADSMYISVKRVSGGTQVQQTITSYPRSGKELYDAILRVHGRHEEAGYEVNFIDASGKVYRGKGRITMPDTSSAQGQPMGYPPYGAPPPPPGYPSQPFQPQQGGPPAAQGQDFSGLLAGFRQLMEMMQAYQAGGPPPAQQPEPTPPGMPGDLIDQMRQMLDMMQQGQPGARPGARVPAQQPAMNPQVAQVMAMMGMGMPPVPPPPGMLFVPGFGYIPVEQLMRAVGGGQLGGGGGGGGGGGYRSGGPYRGPFSPNAAAGGEDPQQRGPSYGPHSYTQRGAAAAVEQPRTAAEQFRDSIALIRTAASAARDFQSLFPGQEAPEPDVATPDDESSPVRVIDTGSAKLVVNKKDGSLRAWETGFANVGPLLKWAADQVEIARTRQQQQPPPKVLPEGYVEVTPGYQPPPGYVAVPENPPPYGGAPSPFPPPPSNIPPPLGGYPPDAQTPPPLRPVPAPASAPAPSPAGRTWGAPTTR